MKKTDLELLPSYFTLAGDIYPFGPTEISPIPFRERVEEAAKAGYKGFGLILPDAQFTAQKLGGYAEMKKILDDNGIKHVEFEFLPDWFRTDERRKQSDVWRKEYLEVCAALSARDLKVAPGLGIDIAHPTPQELAPQVNVMRDEFAKLCEEAAQYGPTKMILEIMPFSNVADIKTGRAIVEGANQPNGGLLVDVWHIGRGGVDYEEINTIKPQFIGAVELDDAPKELQRTLWEDTIYGRLLPGEGDLQVKSFVNTVKATGYNGVWGVEILSEHYRKLPLAEIAKRSFDAAIAQFEP
ncbi:MAG: sugar phosphate isomerase/epimerase [Verrucomicrobia bacterium]|nr:sugar phosphate isomerase/epimerase [Verrucomicrobiota bacterium]MBV8486043.1 sugar phosphate isomerase/epimerase [Verrucomicrobiota bacterium]